MVNSVTTRMNHIIFYWLSTYAHGGRTRFSMMWPQSEWQQMNLKLNCHSIAVDCIIILGRCRSTAYRRIDSLQPQMQFQFWMSNLKRFWLNSFGWVGRWHSLLHASMIHAVFFCCAFERITNYTSVQSCIRKMLHENHQRNGCKKKTIQSHHQPSAISHQLVHRRQSNCKWECIHCLTIHIVCPSCVVVVVMQRKRIKLISLLYQYVGASTGTTWIYILIERNKNYIVWRWNGITLLCMIINSLRAVIHCARSFVFCEKTDQQPRTLMQKLKPFSIFVALFMRTTIIIYFRCAEQKYDGRNSATAHEHRSVLAHVTTKTTFCAKQSVTNWIRRHILKIGADFISNKIKSIRWIYKNTREYQ